MNRRLAAVLLVLCASVLTAGCFPLVVGGAAGGAALIADRRAPDIIATDQRIEWTMGQQIEKRLGDQVHINVTSYNRQVLLTGEVTTPEGKAIIDDIASRVIDVRKVYNEVQIGMPSSLDQRSRDTYITSQVKTRFVNQQKFNPLHVKVVTEAGTVYLMGLVTTEEADEATEIARTTNGVKKVVRLFEYVQLQPSK